MEPPAAAGTQMNTDKKKAMIRKKSYELKMDWEPIGMNRSNSYFFFSSYFVFSLFNCVPAAAGGSIDAYAPDRAKRLPGFTATPPLRHRGHSEAS